MCSFWGKCICTQLGACWSSIAAVARAFWLAHLLRKEKFMFPICVHLFLYHHKCANNHKSQLYDQKNICSIDDLMTSDEKFRAQLGQWQTGRWRVVVVLVCHCRSCALIFHEICTSFPNSVFYWWLVLKTGYCYILYCGTFSCIFYFVLIRYSWISF